MLAWRWAQWARCRANHRRHYRPRRWCDSEGIDERVHRSARGTRRQKGLSANSACTHSWLAIEAQRVALLAAQHEMFGLVANWARQLLDDTACLCAQTLHAFVLVAVGCSWFVLIGRRWTDDRSPRRSTPPPFASLPSFPPTRLNSNSWFSRLEYAVVVTHTYTHIAV